MHAVRMGNVEIVRILINDGNGASSVKPAMFSIQKTTTVFWLQRDKHMEYRRMTCIILFRSELSQNREQKDQDYEEIDMENEDMRWAVEGGRNSK